jgi:hypothetical protein
VLSWLRLERVVIGEDECSLEIKRQIAKIKSTHAKCNIFSSLAYSGAIFTFACLTENPGCCIPAVYALHCALQGTLEFIGEK